MKINYSNLQIITSNIIQSSIESSDGFMIYTDNDSLMGDYSSYTTLYRELDGVYQYSNDGSVYTEPEPIIPYVPTEEELAEIERRNKINNLNAQIESLRAEIASTDYIIIKVSELSFVDKECTEYNITEIHTQRQALRDKINELEKEIELL